MIQVTALGRGKVWPVTSMTVEGGVCALSGGFSRSMVWAPGGVPRLPIQRAGPSGGSDGSVFARRQERRRPLRALEDRAGLNAVAFIVRQIASEGPLRR